ncbi:ATP-binding protein [Fusobacterium polymorphum]|jgi:ATP-binding protein|uniref:ATP-binding protein n=1 Tax=Fusobacterium nucleatum subsp. polymorphum TaxID=76857 RepID=UPI001C6DFCDA|nr:ATP-binding protein [Fusobacterium polymorphum]QYR59498.1 ATP-binding protein [Fusobacterium polymorphum]
MNFIDREKELETLNKEYKKDNSLVVLYGRRRVGKTTLIKEFIKDKKAFYFFADKQNENLQIERFKNQVSEYFKDEFLKKIEIKDWDTVFDYLLTKISNEKFILVIDEFQYLCMINKDFSSIFQRIYDEKLKDKNIMIILCGSLISMMYSETLAYESPLYGRRTAQIKLQAIKFKYYSEFFRDKSTQELIELYSITGGVPKYILSLDRDKSALYNIENNIFDKNNYLYSEPKFLLQEEVNDLSRYFSILNAISTGHTKMSAISSYLQINAGGLSPYISKLIDLGILEKEVPITENIENTKKVLYKIKDNYLKFWFSYVYPYQSYLEIENLTYIKNKIENEFDLYVSKIYEDLARESIWENINFPLFKVGRWWDKNTEIDIVALGEDNKIVFGECKYSNKQVGLNILNELKEKSKKVIWNNNKREEYYILFSKSGFSQDLIELAKKERNILLKELL